MKSFGILFFCLFYSFVWAQNPSQGYDVMLWQEAKDLYNKGLYSTAQGKFQESQQLYSQYTNLSTAQIQEAQWLEALCAFHLLREDADDRLQYFVQNKIDNPYRSEAAFYLAKLRFIKKDFSNLEAHLSTLDETTLTSDQITELQFMRGYLAFKNKDYTLAAQELSEATSSEEYGAEAAFFGAQAYYKTQAFEQAIPLFLQAGQFEKYKTKTAIWLAHCYVQLKKEKELQTLADSIRSNANLSEQKTDIYLLAANYFYENAKPLQALTYFESYIEGKGSPDRSVQYRLAQTYVQAKKIPEAIKNFQQLIQGQDSISQVSAYQLAFIQLEQKQPEEARLSFQKAAGLNFKPEIKQDAHFQYAKLSVQTKYYKEAQQAIETYLSTWSHSPKASEAQSLLGEVYLYTENYPEAIRYFEHSKHSDKRTQIAYQKACYLYAGDRAKAGKTDEALIYYRKSENVNVDPQTTLLAKYWVAEALYKANRMAEAQEAFEHFTQAFQAKSHPLYPYALLAQAWCAFHEKHYAEAGKLFKKAANAIPKKETDLYTEAYLRWGDCHFIQKEYKLALEPYQKIADTGTKDKDYALYQLGVTEARLGNYKKSVRLLEQVVEQYEKSALHDESLDHLSEIYLTWLSDYAKGASYARQLIQQHPESSYKPSAYTHLGIAAYNSKDEEAAVKNFKIVIFEYGENEKQVKVALDALNSILSAQEFENIFAQYRDKYPAVNKALDELAFNMGRDKFQDSEFAKAIDLFTQYLKDYPNGKFCAEALILRGDANQKRNQTEAALKDYEKVWTDYSVSPSAAVALDHASRIYVDQKDYTQALALLDRVEKQATSSADKHKAILAKSRVLIEKRDFVSAKMQLEQLLSEGNISEYTGFRAKLELGKVLYGMKKYKEAADTLDAVEQKADDGTAVEAQYYLAKLFLDQKDYEQAKSAVLYLKENYPAFNDWKSKAFLILAEAYVGLHQKVQAVETLKSLVANSPSEAVKKEAANRIKVLEAEIAKDKADDEEDEEVSEVKKKENPKIEEKKTTQEKPVHEVKKKPTTPTPTKTTPQSVKPKTNTQAPKIPTKTNPIKPK